MKRTYKESSFFQAAQNVKKLGAYYTDLEHCRRIGMLFDFDSADEICVLEPSIGDGSAVRAVTGDRKNVKIFGVELQKETYLEHLKDNEKFHMVLNEDFLRGVKISRGVFSFVFANPPYGTQNEDSDSKRLELLFLEKISNYVKSGAYVVYVIPFAVFKEERFLRTVLGKYEICSFYRFDEKEYEKYHQVAVILRKKKSGLGGYLKSALHDIWEKIMNLEDFPYLPRTEDELQVRYEVIPSKDQEVEYFTSLEFHPDEAVDRLDSSSLYELFNEEIFPKAYKGCDLNHPLVPVSKEISYLLAVSGGGQGMAGNEDEGTLHLQRGSARKSDDQGIEYDEKNKPKKITVTSYTKIQLNIIQNDGTITQL